MASGTWTLSAEKIALQVLLGVAETEPVFYSQGRRYLSLHTGMNSDGVLTGEPAISQNGYMRQLVQFGLRGNGEYGNDANIIFTNLDSMSVTYLGVMETPAGNSALYYIPLTAAVSVPQGGSFVSLADQIRVGGI